MADWGCEGGAKPPLIQGNRTIETTNFNKINERKSYELVYRAQNSWSAQRVTDCKVNRLDEKNGIKIPAIFGDREDITEEAQSDDRGIENRTALDILVTGTLETESFFIPYVVRAIFS